MDGMAIDLKWPIDAALWRTIFFMYIREVAA